VNRAASAAGLQRRHRRCCQSDETSMLGWATAWTVTDCLRRWNDEVATHSKTQTASMEVSRNWLTYVHQVTGC